MYAALPCGGCLMATIVSGATVTTAPAEAPTRTPHLPDETRPAQRPDGDPFKLPAPNTEPVELPDDGRDRKIPTCRLPKEVFEGVFVPHRPSRLEE